MRRKLVGVSVARLLVGLSCFGSLACSQSKVVVRGVEVSVESMERLDLWQGYAAASGKEYIVLHVSVDARAVPNQLTLPAPALENVDGSRGVTPIVELTVSGGAEHEPELGFLVSKGAVPKSIVFGDVRLDLASFR